LANLCHGEYSECPPVAQMQPWRSCNHCWVPRWKNFENRSTFAKVVGN